MANYTHITVNFRNRVRDRGEFEESKHPRAANGQFGAGSGSSSSHKSIKAEPKEKLSIAGGKPQGGIPLKYDAATKQHVGEGVAPERVKKLAIPPGWQNVRLSHDHDADLQVLATDAKGRPQYRYSDAFAASNKAKKFERVGRLAHKSKDINDMSHADTKAGSDTAAAVRLMLLTGMRPGGDEDTQAKVKAHGATTLLKHHVRTEGDMVHYEFTGKKGVNIKNSIKDPVLAGHIRNRLSQNDGDRLFNTDASKANSYVKKATGDDFKSKDLRTLKANHLAAKTVSAMPVPKTAKERTAAINKVADVVSSQLGNTRSVALSDYINPTVFAPWGPDDEK